MGGPPLRPIGARLAGTSFMWEDVRNGVVLKHFSEHNLRELQFYEEVFKAADPKLPALQTGELPVSGVSCLPEKEERESLSNASEHCDDNFGGVCEDAHCLLCTRESVGRRAGKREQGGARHRNNVKCYRELDALEKHGLIPEFRGWFEIRENLEADVWEYVGDAGRHKFANEGDISELGANRSTGIIPADLPAVCFARSLRLDSRRTKTQGANCYVLALENLLADYEEPCTADFKLGNGHLGDEETDSSFAVRREADALVPEPKWRRELVARWRRKKKLLRETHAFQEAHLLIQAIKPSDLINACGQTQKVGGHEGEGGKTGSGKNEGHKVEDGKLDESDLKKLGDFEADKFRLALKSWRQQEVAAHTTQASLGFRISGLKYYTAEHGSVHLCAREWGMAADSQAVQQQTKSFFRAEVSAKLYPKLRLLQNWLREQKRYRFYATSLFVYYEKNDPSKCDLRFIDFSHAIPICHNSDEECNTSIIKGLESILQCLDFGPTA